MVISILCAYFLKLKSRFFISGASETPQATPTSVPVDFVKKKKKNDPGVEPAVGTAHFRGHHPGRPQPAVLLTSQVAGVGGRPGSGSVLGPKLEPTPRALVSWTDMRSHTCRIAHLGGAWALPGTGLWAEVATSLPPPPEVSLDST